MKFVGLGVVAGGAMAAAFLGTATANADTTWTPDYTIDDAQVLQGANSLTWAVPATFTPQ